jgi:hypothetical protein
MHQLPQQASDRALAVLELHRANLMATPGVIGAGVGATDGDETEPAIVIYLDRTAPVRPQFAQSMDGVAVRIILSDPFVAFYFQAHSEIRVRLQWTRISLFSRQVTPVDPSAAVTGVATLEEEPAFRLPLH